MLIKSQIAKKYVAKIGDTYYYNFWQDSKHIKGLLRRTTFESYKSLNPAWETVIDIDLLSQQENENWVYKGMSYVRCFII